MQQPSAHSVSAFLTASPGRGSSAGTATTAGAVGTPFGTVLHGSPPAGQGPQEAEPPRAPGGNLLPSGGTALPVPEGDAGEVSLLAEMAADGPTAFAGTLPAGTMGDRAFAVRLAPAGAPPPADQGRAAALSGQVAPAGPIGRVAGLPVAPVPGSAADAAPGSPAAQTAPAAAPPASALLHDRGRHAGMPGIAAGTSPDAGSQARTGAERPLPSPAALPGLAGGLAATADGHGRRGSDQAPAGQTAAAAATRAAAAGASSAAIGAGAAGAFPGGRIDGRALAESSARGTAPARHSERAAAAYRPAAAGRSTAASGAAGRSERALQPAALPGAGTAAADAGEVPRLRPDPGPASGATASAAPSMSAPATAPAPAPHAAVSGSPGMPATASFPIDAAVLDPAWQAAVSERLAWMAGRNVQSAELRLNPAELGPLHVQVSVDDGKSVSLSISAAHPLTREALEGAIPRLRDMLADNGMDLSGATVSDQGVGAQREGSAGDRDVRGDAGSAIVSAEDAGTPTADESPSAGHSRPRGTVDLFA